MRNLAGIALVKRLNDVDHKSVNDDKFASLKIHSLLVLLIRQIPRHSFIRIR